MRQSQPSGDERRKEGAELLVGRDHAMQAAPAITRDDLLHEAQRVEREEARVIGEAEEVEALEVELVAAGVACIARGKEVPLVGKQNEDATFHASILRWAERQRVRPDVRGPAERMGPL